MYYKYLIYCFLAIFISSCNSNSEKKKDDNISEDSSATNNKKPEQNQSTSISDKDNIPIVSQNTTYDFTKGKIVYNQKGKHVTSIRYSYYAPETISDDPTLFFLFDPHGEINIPFEKYKTLADSYNLILVGSSQIKNELGTDISSTLYNDILEECANAFPIDSQQAILCGFSGGARVASYIASNLKKTQGIILCGAGFSGNLKPKNTFYSALIAGKKDMNFRELHRLKTNLDQAGYPNDLFIHNGEHEWPAIEELEKAYLWILGSQYRLKDKTLEAANINKVLSLYSEKFTDKIDEYNRLVHLINTLSAHSEISDYEAELKNILTNQEFIRNRDQLIETMSDEAKLQQRLYENILNYDMERWNKELKHLDYLLESKDLYVSDAAFRTKSYMSLVCYLLADDALNKQNINAAGKFLDIYYLFDPENPDCSYLWSCFHCLKENPAPAKGVLLKAHELGFDDCQKIIEDDRLELIKKEPEIQTLISNLGC
jgi:predicted esterase